MQFISKQMTDGWDAKLPLLSVIVLQNTAWKRHWKLSKASYEMASSVCTALHGVRLQCTGAHLTSHPWHETFPPIPSHRRSRDSHRRVAAGVACDWLGARRAGHVTGEGPASAELLIAAGREGRGQFVGCYVRVTAVCCARAAGGKRGLCATGEERGWKALRLDLGGLRARLPIGCAAQGRGSVSRHFGRALLQVGR